MSTATKERKAAAADLVEANAAAAKEDYERYREKLASEYHQEVRVLDRIVAENESLEVADLQLSAGELIVCEKVCERQWPDRTASLHDVATLLQQHRDANALREKYGDPEILAAAQKRLADAVEAERATSATLTDLEVTGPTANDPASTLAKQIKRLSEKLDALIATRQACEAEVQTIEAARAKLRSRTPAWLARLVERELGAARRRLPCFRALQKLDHEIAELTGFQRVMDNDRSASGSPIALRNSQELAFAFAKLHCPEAIGAPVAAGRVPPVDIEKLVKFSDEKLPGLVAALEARRAQLVAECDSIRCQVERPLDDFCHSGVV